MSRVALTIGDKVIELGDMQSAEMLAACLTPHMVERFRAAVETTAQECVQGAFQYGGSIDYSMLPGGHKGAEIASSRGLSAKEAACVPVF